MKNGIGCKLLVLLVLLFQQCYAKVLIVVPVYNRPDFIELQYKTFKKFLKDDYMLMMFNDADNETMQHEIEAACAKYDISCIRVPQTVHNVDPLCGKAPASFRHGEVLQFAFENYAFHHDDIVTIFDSDMFLMRDFSIREYMAGYDITAYEEKYFTLHFGSIDMPQLQDRHDFNFRCRVLDDGTFYDVGYKIYAKYFPEHRHAMKIKPVHVITGLFEDMERNQEQYTDTQLLARGYTEAQIDLIRSIVNLRERFSPVYGFDAASYDCDIGLYEESLVLDYKHGSGWHGARGEITRAKDKVIKDFIHSLL
jgi:hypothetical protein